MLELDFVNKSVLTLFYNKCFFRVVLPDKKNDSQHMPKAVTNLFH